MSPSLSSAARYSESTASVTPLARVRAGFSAYYTIFRLRTQSPARRPRRAQKAAADPQRHERALTYKISQSKRYRRLLRHSAGGDTESIRQKKEKNPNRSPAQRVRFGKEEQRHERALTYKISRSKRYRRLLRYSAGGDTESIRQKKEKNPNRSPAQRVRFGKEEQRHERALTYKISRSKRYRACSDVVRVVIQHFSKNTVISMVLGHPNSEITCIPPS